MITKKNIIKKEKLWNEFKKKIKKEISYNAKHFIEPYRHYNDIPIPNGPDKEKNIEITTLLVAYRTFLDIQIQHECNETFKKMTDDEKIKFINTYHKQFCDNYPILSKLMILTNEFNKYAFLQLLKVKNKLMKELEPSQKSKQILINTCAATYIKYLFIDNNRNNPAVNKKMVDEIYSKALKSFEKETKNFDKSQKNIIKKIKNDRGIQKKHLLDDISTKLLKDESIKNKIINDKEFLELVEKLEYLESKKKYKMVLSDLMSRTNYSRAKISGYGTNVGIKNYFENERRLKNIKNKNII